MNTLIELRTPESQKLIGRLDPGTMRLHVRLRGEMCVFDLAELAGGLIRVRTGELGDAGAGAVAEQRDG